ncbi:MAG: TIGR04255 family protein [Ectothiorhodospiraceae bacterium]|uniref:TIGR04255 family protein n=1 Tax=Thioalkalivibrio sp. HL-Eb18 TaxID=1266913 RepID=UPI0003797A8B|nr:TIGR04255 family protein [Thioalkalivibrio sp. HL-Eb18]MCC5811291.1 TIGR04255 family protein [Ectothiorhodospiraceae bacterium]
MDPDRVPVRLKHDPIVEALWEIRFSSETPSVSDLLPGLIFQNLKRQYSRIEKLPVSQLPAPVLQSDPSLRYAPQVRLVGPKYSVQVGNKVVSLSCPAPYSGWEQFEFHILELADALKETQLLDKIERFSLKYVDFISFDESPSLDWIRFDLKLGARSLSNNPIQLRTEIRERDLLKIVQVVNPANVRMEKGEKKSVSKSGLLVDIDTIDDKSSSDFWTEFPSRLKHVHDEGKKLFFEILSPSTRERLGPEY